MFVIMSLANAKYLNLPYPTTALRFNDMHDNVKIQDATQ